MTGAALYGARTIKRERRTQERVAQLDQQIMEELADDHPQSVRHVFYRMTNPRLPEPVEKSARGYRHVQNRCVLLRRDGRVAYGWLSDATRRGYFTNTYHDKADFIRRMAGLYRSDLWAEADCRCEVWVESRSIAGVIQDLCEELAVDLYPAGGFSSISFAHDAAQAINAEFKMIPRPTMVYYVGDYDPAGVLIDVALERELRAHLAPRVELVFERIGISRDQIEQYDLPTKPRKESDKRSPQVEYAVEAEAMPANILRELLRNKIEALLPAHALEIAKVAEEDEQRGLRLLAFQLREAQP